MSGGGGAFTSQAGPLILSTSKGHEYTPPSVMPVATGIQGQREGAASLPPPTHALSVGAGLLSGVRLAEDEQVLVHYEKEILIARQAAP